MATSAGVDAWVLRRLRLFQAITASLGIALVAVAAVTLSGTTVSGTGHHEALPPTPPSPGASSSTPLSSSSAPSSPKPSKSTPPGRCSTSDTNGAGGFVPVHICIPAIGVNANMVQLGLNADRTVEVPPLSEVGLAGWYKYSPAPGRIGPTIILGHVDSAEYGDGVFYELGRLKSGDMVSLRRADGMIAKYRIDHVAEYPKSNFPTQTVYGNTSGATIRLITCGGTFDPSIGSYEDNIVAFGNLASLKKG